VLCCPDRYRSLTAGPIGLKIGTNAHWNYAMKIGGRRSRVRIDACAASHIQHRRPNCWTGRDPNWYKHSLEQWAEVMVIGDRECALMCALRAQTCVQHYTSSIGGQTAGSIGAQIGTNTHWNNGQKLWGSAIAGAQNCAQNCAQHHIVIISGQTAGSIRPQIGTNTHWDNGRSYGSRR
jgi:hypothetical protein